MNRTHFLIDLIVEAPSGLSWEETDGHVRSVVEYSTAREAIETGLDGADGRYAVKGFRVIGALDEGES